MLKWMICITTNHPFYTEIGEWVEAINLKLGDKILHVDGEYHEVKTLEQSDYSTTVYNFEVENDHTYFAEGYLVHNKVIEDQKSRFIPISGETRPGNRKGGRITRKKYRR